MAKGDCLVLSPRGISSTRVEKELRECLLCVLDALTVMLFRQFLSKAHPCQVAHQVSLYHRDIRWENIAHKEEDELKWSSIDREDAITLPTWARPSFNKATHFPAIFGDGQGPKLIFD